MNYKNNITLLFCSFQIPPALPQPPAEMERATPTQSVLLMGKLASPTTSQPADGKKTFGQYYKTNIYSFLLCLTDSIHHY